MDKEKEYISELLYDEINSECLALKDIVNDFVDEIQIVKTEKASEFLLNGYMVAIPRKLAKLCDLRKLYEKYKKTP